MVAYLEFAPSVNVRDETINTAWRVAEAMITSSS